MALIEQNVCDGVQWIDVVDPTQQEVEELAATYGLNSFTVRDCMQPEHLPKYEFVDDVHFLILRFYAHATNGQSSTIRELTNKIAIFYTEGFIITIHKAEAHFLEVIRKRYVSNARCETTTSLLAKVLWWALESYDDPANRLSEQVDFYENQVMLKRTSEDYMERLFYIKREASLTHKVLMLMLEPINNIFVRNGEEVELQNVRDQHLKMQTLYSQVLDDVNNLMNMYMSYQAQRTNEVVKVLTVFSVFFMPLTFIAGIYGMNFDFMPELRQRWGYPGVLVLMGLVALGIYLYFRRKGWLR
ncbi:magnesium transporter CorA [Flavisolibacter sp. BT320]|nr:magnesium transporter CorA [Flavisolibacter longurius]